jgi:hypothetical protein
LKRRGGRGRKGAREGEVEEVRSVYKGEEGRE